MQTPLPPELLRTAALCAALLIFGAGSLWLSMSAIEDARTTLIATRAARQQAADMLRLTQHETNEIKRAHTRLGELRLIDPHSSTPGWDRAQTSLQHDNRVLSLDLHAWTAPNPGTTEIPEPNTLPTIQVQHLTLRIDLLHEEGLTAALQTFTDTHNATVIPLGCAIERLESISPALRARCEFEWLTLHPTTSGPRS